MSARDRLIPTETNPIDDKSLPPTPAVPPAGNTGKDPIVAATAPNGSKSSVPGVVGQPQGNEYTHGNSNDSADSPPQPTNTDKDKSDKDEKKALMDRLQPPKGSKPTDLAQQKGDRWEKDPVTGGDVLIRDSKLKGNSLLL